MAKLELLKPRVRELAEKLRDECKRAGYDIIFPQTLRTIAEQDELYAQGRTKPGKIVTNARGGFSFHNYGVAFDICPLVDGKPYWNNLALFDAIGRIGVSLGLEWGGLWKGSLVDRPHFEYTAGYSLADFRNSKVDWKKFEVSNKNVILSPKPATLKVVAQEGLNIRSGPGTENPKIGKLSFGEMITPIEKSNNWVKIKYKDGFGWISASYLE